MKIWHDVRYAARTMRRNPGFATVILVSLAIGIGANAVIFSAFDQVLYEKLPVREPDRLAIVRYTLPQGGLAGDFSYAIFEQLRNRSHSFDGMFAHDGTSTVLSIDGLPESIPGTFVSGSYYSVLGIGAVRGRVFTTDDDHPGAAPVVVLRYEYWKRRFGLDPRAIGKTVNIKDLSFTIIGVTPPSFAGYSMLNPADVSIPFVWQPRLGLKDHTSVGVIARVASGVSREQAAADLTVILRDALRVNAGSELTPERELQIAAERIRLAPGARGLTGIQDNHSLQVTVLMSAVGLLLLTACANIAGLLIARANARQKEIAVRIAIGAGRVQLIRQMLVESLMFAISGGALGLFLALWGGEAMPRLLDVAIEPRLSLRLVLFTAAISIATGLLFGLTPALWSTELEPLRAMKAGSGSRATRLGPSVGKMLVSGQVALSICILLGAGLLVRTLRNLNNINPGFRSEGVILGWVVPTLAGYEGAAETRLYDDIVRNCRTLPDVASMTVARHSLMQGADRITLDAPGRAMEPASAAYNAIGPGFFETMQIPFLRGRDFRAADRALSPAVAIVNESLARQFFREGDPLGRHIRLNGNTAVAEIIGVVRDTRWYSLRQATTKLQVYVPYSQAPAEALGQMQIIVRSAYEPSKVIPELRRAVAAIDAHLPITGVTTQKQQVLDSANNERSLAALTSLFGAVTLLISVIGLYGLISYSVTCRVKEMGIRMALGATEEGVVWLIVKETIAVAAAGAVLGIPSGLAATRLISSFLYGITATDPATLCGVVLLVLFFAAAAGFAPAYRGSKVDPMIALRYE